MDDAQREHGITRQRVVERNGPHVEASLPTVWQHALDWLAGYDHVGE